MEFANKIRDKNIHLVGATGSEGSSILKFLLKNNIANITVHDFIDKSDLEKSYKKWHKGINESEKEKLFRDFNDDCQKVIFNFSDSYLKGIEEADIIFVPQSWKLYIQNRPLFKIQNKGTPFYSLTRLYLDNSSARIIAVTGTVGKGSTVNLIYNLLKNSGKKVYLAGNETWMPQIADQIDSLDKEGYLILEISHRQLQESFTRAPEIIVYTNIYPNHLDEMSWYQYKNLKLSLLKKQKKSDLAILNHDEAVLRDLDFNPKSRIYYYSQKNKLMNTKNIQKRFEKILNIKNDQYLPNILAALTVCDILSLNFDSVLEICKSVQSLSARAQILSEKTGIEFIDDLKSTTPWATLSAVKKYRGNLTLIMGGDTKKIDYRQFFKEIEPDIKNLVILKSQLSQEAARYYPDIKFKIYNDIYKAIDDSYRSMTSPGKILISPGAAFFYTQFIEGKKSIKKIITSLPPKVQV